MGRLLPHRLGHRGIRGNDSHIMMSSIPLTSHKPPFFSTLKSPPKMTRRRPPRGKPKEVVNLLEQPNYLVEEKYPTPIESPRIFLWPPFLPVCLPYTCLSGKLFSILPVAPASVHYTLIRQIAALGYSVTGFPLPHTDLSPLPPGVWHCAVVLGDHGGVVV